MEGAGWHHINVKDGKRYSTKEGYLDPAVVPREPDREPALAGDEADPRERQAASASSTSRTARSRRRARRARSSSAAARSSRRTCCWSRASARRSTCGRTGSTSQVELPGVGENFHNHVLTGVIREGKQQVPTGKQNLSEVALFCKSDPALAGARPADRVRARARSTSSSGRRTRTRSRSCPGVVRPLSRGYVRLSSADPLVKPRVNPNYLAAKADRDRLVQGVRARARALRDEGVLGLGRRGAAARPRRRQLRRRPQRVRHAQGRLVPPPGRLVPHGPRRARRRRPRAARARRSRACASPTRA